MNDSDKYIRTKQDRDTKWETHVPSIFLPFLCFIFQQVKVPSPWPQDLASMSWLPTHGSSTFLGSEQIN